MPWHIVAVVMLQSTAFTLFALLPVIVRKRFDAGDWQTLLITAAPTVLFTLSIFWNDYFARRAFGRYMTTLWLVYSAPLLLMGFADSYWLIAVPHLISSIGGAGYHPAAGTLLKRLYPIGLQGRIYSLVWGTSMVAGAAMGFGMGKWLEADADAYRWIMPLTALFQLAGAFIFTRLAGIVGADDGRVKADTGGGLVRRVLEPIGHTTEVLRADPIFARYEAAYMTYGVGWMIAYALLPMLVTDRLNLSYDQAANSTHVAYLAGMVLMLWPAGYLMDRIGAIRSTGLSFAMLSVYPLGLLMAGDASQLALVSFLYGVSHAGASVGWMLGPVSLAPSPEKVPQYVAIHATFVGLRGKVFQLLGVGLYVLTRGFTWPLVIAAAAFLWSAVMMWQLHRRRVGTGRA